jgi:hypothetical protein
MSNDPAEHRSTEEIVIVGEFPSVFRVGMLGCVTVIAWFGRLEKASAEVLARVTVDCVARLQGRVGSSVHLVDARVKLPDADAREVLAQIMRTSARDVACVSVVVDGGGFWASAMRSFITSLSVLAPRSVELHAHASIDQVLAWLPPEHHKRTGVTVQRDALERLLLTGKGWQDDAARTPRD